MGCVVEAREGPATLRQLIGATARCVQTSEGQKPKGVIGASCCLNRRTRIDTRLLVPSLEGEKWSKQTPIQPQEGSGAREGIRLAIWGQTPKGKSHRRIRDEISPVGYLGSKASRGCEILRTQTVDVRGSTAAYGAPDNRETSKGPKPRKVYIVHAGCGSYS